jgi:endonuclease YncB( thermonuclease family)
MLRICALFVLLALPGAAFADFSGPVRVIDGDTLDVGTVRVRLHGIDAPEMAQSCVTRTGRDIACGVWVRDETERRLAGRAARCTALDTDRYGRTVARCVVGGRDIGAELVSDGLAFAYRKYSDDYVRVELAAAGAAKGLHAMQVQSPEQFRRHGAAPATAPQDCVIKGNISKNGHIYHVPGQKWYAKTRIDTRKGERMFCSEAEARKAGWRKARQ